MDNRKQSFMRKPRKPNPEREYFINLINKEVAIVTMAGDFLDGTVQWVSQYMIQLKLKDGSKLHTIYKHGILRIIT